MSLTPTGSPATVSFGSMPASDFSPASRSRERLQVQLEEFDIEGEEHGWGCELILKVRSMVGGVN